MFQGIDIGHPIDDCSTMVGIDEVGRGPLAGPVVAAAVILDPKVMPVGLTDSKKLSAKKRAILASEITDSAIAWALGRCEVEEIDHLNIFHASLEAMRRAYHALGESAEVALVDGKFIPELPIPARAIVKGDLKVPAISAASIVAKVMRDKEMEILAEQYPLYGFAQHKGYGTAKHLAALSEFGPCPQHRRSFRPVREALAGGAI